MQDLSTGFMDSSYFKIATFNANSLRSRIDIVKSWLVRHQPDVLCIQETKVQDADFPIEHFSQIGYGVVKKGQKAYNGVAIASKIQPEDIIKGLEGTDPQEARFITAKYSDITIINTYVPQGYSRDSFKYQYKLEWFKKLRDFLDRSFTPESPVIWAGDLNVAPESIDVHDPKGLLGHVCFNPEVQGALYHVKEWGFVDVFRKMHPGEPNQYTFFDYRVRNAVQRKLGWRVDHIMATKSLADKTVDTYIDLEPRLQKRPSDHTFVAAEFAL